MVALSLGTGVDADAYRRPGAAPAPVRRPAPIDPPRLVGSGRIGTVVRAEPGALERRAQLRLPLAARRRRHPRRHRADLQPRPRGRPAAARRPGHRDQRRRPGFGRGRRARHRLARRRARPADFPMSAISNIQDFRP